MDTTMVLQFLAAGSRHSLHEAIARYRVTHSHRDIFGVIYRLEIFQRGEMRPIDLSSQTWAQRKMAPTP